MKEYIFATLVFVLSLSCFGGIVQAADIEYVDSFANVNHPEIAYWFFSKELLENERYLTDLDKLASDSKFDMIFLTARNGVNFYDYANMRPIFKKLVERAHLRGIKIGLQLWEDRSKPIAIEDTERIITEGEITLDNNGEGKFTAIAKHVRDPKSIIRSEIFKAFAFKKTSDGFYDLDSLKDITSLATSRSVDPSTLQVDVNSKGLSGYRVYIMAQHYYRYRSNHSPEASQRFIEALDAYRDIPFDGAGLDEYTNLRVTPIWELDKNKEPFRERSYSLSMAKEFQKRYGRSLDRAMFDMRFAPDGRGEVRAAAINQYMDTMREGTMHVENAFYKKAKEVFGKGTFAGLHETHHNSLSGDEIWVTGLNWWNVPREFGQTDESTPTPTQLGIAMSSPGNILYNMFYNKRLDTIIDKSLTDLRYGVRTHYHAINDVQGWGVSVEKPEAITEINKVENCARLLNRFNPALPETKLLVVFGMEALQNWYPNEAQRGLSDINDKLLIEEKARQIWDAGYRNALVPSDLISSGKLTLNSENKPVINGHVFDAIVYLYPQYSKETTLKFLESFLSRGGKLMLEGSATLDFNGRDITRRFNAIRERSSVRGFSIGDLAKLGVIPNAVANGSKNSDGSYVFTDTGSLGNNKTASFTIEIGQDNYSAAYKGLAAIQADGRIGMRKFTAAGFTSLRKNGEVLLSFDSPVDIFVDMANKTPMLTIADRNKMIKPTVNRLLK
jgi:hypothetical protein